MEPVRLMPTTEDAPGFATVASGCPGSRQWRFGSIIYIMRIKGPGAPDFGAVRLSAASRRSRKARIKILRKRARDLAHGAGGGDDHGFDGRADTHSPRQ